ncbi:hypothetical protein [Shinella zoogloeoides]|uniref:hypothetical protein n=1 Tax=Shinella zoogloeoides TaxID=352475 RepID=UPI001F55AC7E|nr:hypothetical protein [Shinella zoogloeoides]
MAAAAQKVANSGEFGSGVRPGSRWVTNSGVEFLNSLCPNKQYPFPDFDWLRPGERECLSRACGKAFDAVCDSWAISVFARLRLKVDEQRVLAVIDLKTLRFRKLADKITRETFLGDDRKDKHDFNIVPPTGLYDGNLSRSLKTLKEKGLIGCVKAVQYKGREASNIYSVAPINNLIEIFLAGLHNALCAQTDIEEQRLGELHNLLSAEIRARCADIIAEDSANLADIAKGSANVADVSV